LTVIDLGLTPLVDARE